MDKVKIERIPLRVFIETLQKLYMAGVDFVDIHGEHNEGMDYVGVSFKEEYMSQEMKEEEILQENKDKKLTQEDIDKLL